MNLHESASVDTDGRLNITLNNLSVSDFYDIEGIIVDRDVKSVKDTILTGEMSDCNTFNEAEVVKTAKFINFTITNKGLNFTIPKCSIVHFIIE